MQRWEKLYVLVVIGIIVFAAYSTGFLTSRSLKLFFGKMMPYAFYNDAQATNWWDVDNYAVPTPTITIPPSESHLATDGGYKTAGTSYTTSSGGTYNDTHADDGVTFWAEASYEGWISSAYTEVYIWVNITDIGLSNFKLTWDLSYGSLGGTFVREIKVKLYLASGETRDVSLSFSTSGTQEFSETQTVNQLDFIVHIKTYARCIEGECFSSSKAELDYVCVSLPSDTASVDCSTRYIGTIAGTTSKIMGYFPLFGNYYEAYGYWVNITFADWWTGSGSVTLSFSPSSQTSLDKTIADFCVFIYSIPSTSIVSDLLIKIRYQFNSLSVVYIIQRSTTESLEVSVSGSEYIARLYTSVFPRWVGLKDFDNLQLMDIIEKAGGSSVDASQESLQGIDIEVTVTKGSSTEKAEIITVWDWFGSWEPASQIDYLSMQVNYRIQSSGLDKLGIVSLPTINYDPEKYRYVYFFYDTRYPLDLVPEPSTDYDGDNAITSWDYVYNFFTMLQQYLVDAGFVVAWVDAEELRTVMDCRHDIIVVIMGGILPDTIYTGDTYLQNWIKSGGILVYMGTWLGYYYGKNDGTRVTVGGTGDDKVLGHNIIDWYGAGSTNLEVNRTRLGELIDYSYGYVYDRAWYAFEQKFILEWYLNYFENPEAIVFVYDRHILRGDVEYIRPSDVRTYFHGWIKVGEGWAGNFGAKKWYYVSDQELKAIAQDVTKAILVLLARVSGYEWYNPDYITDSVWGVDNFSGTAEEESEDVTPFSENFEDVSDWTFDSGLQYSVSSGILTVTVPKGASVTWWDWKNLVTFDPYYYPIIEFAYVTNWTNEGGFKAGLHIRIDYDSDGDGVLDKHVDLSIPLTTKWSVYRINIYGLTGKSRKVRVCWFYIYNGKNSYGYEVKLDWIRVYSIDDIDSLYYGNGVDGGEVFIEYLGYLGLQITTEDDGLWDVFGICKKVTVEAGDWIEVRVKYSGDHTGRFVIRYWNSTKGTYITMIDWHPSSSTDWVILRGQFPYSGTVYLEILNHEYVVSPSWEETETFLIDYIRIGKKGDWRPIYEAPLGKVYNNPARIISDSITIDKLRFSETLDYGVLDIKIGVLTIAWGVESVSGDLIVATSYYESQKLTIIHTYSMYYALRVENIANPYKTEDFILPITALITSILLTLQKKDRERVLIIRILGIVIAVLLIVF